MKSLSISKRMIIAAVTLVVVASAAALAAIPPDTPLPLPDVIFYGTTTYSGELVTEGTVKAVLPRGGIVSAAIGEIAGTDYTYALAVPLSMYDPDNDIYEAGSARTGEAISFYIDALPALFQDDNGITASEFVIPEDAVGETYIVDLILTGPGGYPLGDVNANGRRDSADALLVLKYDIGLIVGVDYFPPGPGTVYLPLCDIIEDGQCNSSDALRILQCDVGMPGVDCPAVPSSATALSPRTPTEDATLVLRTEIEGGPEACPECNRRADTVIVRVVAYDPLAELGAASLELRYDTVLLAPEACTADPDGLLDAAMCNTAFAPGIVRFNAISTAGTGAGDGTALAEITFRALDPAVIEHLDGALRLAPDDVFDIEGNDLPWRIEGTPAQHYHLYLPFVTRTEIGD